MIHKTGIPILWKSFQKSENESDSTLAAGLLSAISSFSKQVFGESFQKLEFENLEITLSSLAEGAILLGIVASKGDPTASILISYLIPPLESFFEKNKVYLTEKHYSAQELQQELNEIIEMHTTRFTAPTFSEVQAILQHIYPNIVTMELFEKHLKFKKEMNAIYNLALKNTLNANIAVQNALERESNKDSKKEIMSALSYLDKLEFKKASESLLKAFNSTAYGTLAKLLFTKLVAIATYFGSDKDMPSESLLKKILSTISDSDTRIKFLLDLVQDYVKTYCSEDPIYIFQAVPIFTRYDDEIVNLINTERNQLNKEIYAYLAMPLGIYLKSTTQSIKEIFKERKSIFYHWCELLLEMKAYKSRIYSVRDWNEISELLSSVKQEYLNSKSQLMLNNSKKDYIEIQLRHLQNTYKQIYLLFTGLETRKISLHDKEEILNEIIEIWESEKEFIFSVHDAIAPRTILISIYLWVFTAYLYFESILPPEKFNKKISSLALIVESILQLVIELKYSKKISLGLYQIFVIQLFGIITSLAQYLNIKETYILHLLVDVNEINAQKFEELRRSDYFLYLTSITNFIIGLSKISKRQKRDADRIFVAKRNIDFLNRLARIFLLLGRVVNSVFLSILENYTELVLLSQEDDLYIALREAEALADGLLRNPEIDVLSKVKILSQMAELEIIASEKLKENEAKIAIEKALKNYNNIIVLLTMNRVNEQLIEYFVNERKKLLSKSSATNVNV